MKLNKNGDEYITELEIRAKECAEKISYDFPTLLLSIENIQKLFAVAFIQGATYGQEHFFERSKKILENKD